jgi:hypothetical protein
VDQLDDVFRQIVQDLDGQYNVRWASLKRDDESFIPSFNLVVNTASVTYTASQSFVPTRYEGDVLRGSLRLVPSGDEESTTVFLRASYVPRAIRRMVITGQSDFDFSVALVGTADDGLMAGWNEPDFTQDPETGEFSIEVRTTGPAIDFATFGPMLRFGFDVQADNPQELFTAFEVDNTIYAETGEQYFVVEGF